MDKNYNIGSKKFLFLIIGVCLLFLIIVVNALSYLPENNPDTLNSKNVNSYADKNNFQQANEESTESEKISRENTDIDKKTTIKVDSSQQYTDEMVLDEIKAPDGAGISIENETPSQVSSTVKTPEETAYETLKTAAEYRASKQYIKSLDEYQKIPSITSDTNIVAAGYDGIASLYAINKRYGTALTFAIKAYNMAPTSEREMFLARLYYKTGNVDKATQRINNILRRDFSEDKW